MNEIQGELERRLGHLEQALQTQDNAIIELKALLVRAADALEKYTSYPIGMIMSATLRESGRSVLAELRKAAE